jgi:colanic acid/amylovoran biosynthesis glycosyltransferase
MLTVAYLANEFPSAVEPYVVEEIEELSRRGVRVITGSVRKPAPEDVAASNCPPQIVLRPPHAIILLHALGLCIWRWKRIWPLISRIVLHGREGPIQRMKALAHTWLGACYAVLLKGTGIEHIHVHHGYLGAWIAMVAARLLVVKFSITLHGSDVLLHGTYLDTKLENSLFCLTVSEYNRNYLLERYPTVEAEKVIMAHLGVEVLETAAPVVAKTKMNGDSLTFLAVGRLHAVKDHAFLVRACAQLQRSGVPFECLIAGDGPEWRNLASLIGRYGLEERVTLLGHVAHQNLNSWYDRADVVVLTSQSEGIPLVLMEAMARRKIVLAPAITGIPELVIAGKTGFLYKAGSMDDFVARLLFIRSLMQAPDDFPSPGRKLDQIRHAARVQVRENFNRRRRLQTFGDFFLRRVGPQAESLPHEDFVLQQI